MKDEKLKKGAPIAQHSCPMSVIKLCDKKRERKGEDLNITVMKQETSEQSERRKRKSWYQIWNTTKTWEKRVQEIA